MQPIPLPVVSKFDLAKKKQKRESIVAFTAQFKDVAHLVVSAIKNKAKKAGPRTQHGVVCAILASTSVVVIYAGLITCGLLELTMRLN
jgi:hypothetical protein